MDSIPLPINGMAFGFIQLLKSSNDKAIRNDDPQPGYRKTQVESQG